jgi:mannan endo-1,4-beta-mannosidase
MPARKILAATLTLALLASAGCSLSQPGTSSSAASETPVKETAVYEPVEASADYVPSTGTLNDESAATVATALANKACSLADNGDGTVHFDNAAAGYAIDLPNSFSIADMGDATYRAVLGSPTTRIEIFNQKLDVDALTFMGYSNKFLETNTADYTKTLEEPWVLDTSIAGTGTKATNDDIVKDVTPSAGSKDLTWHWVEWNRRVLAKVADDRPYYACVDLMDSDHNSWTIFVTSTVPIDQSLDMPALIDSFTAYEPTVEAKEYPRGCALRTNLNQETLDFYNSTLAQDAPLTWGLFPPISGESQFADMSEVHQIQDELDYHFPILLHYTNLSQTYNITDILTRARDDGHVVELTLQTPVYDAQAQANMVYDVLDGKYDNYLHQYAAEVAAFGHPVLFRPFNEMNGDWCVYSAYWAARDCSTYVELYRYLYNIFEQEGANANTLWVWNPNEKSFPNFAWNDADNYYPGDKYVDVVGLTGYNTGNYYEGETWRSFKEIYEPLYKHMAPQYSQPLMITEFACSAIGGDKPAWAEDMFSDLQDHPRIKIAVWWDGCDMDGDKQARPYFIDDSQEIMDVFKKNLTK